MASAPVPTRAVPSAPKPAAAAVPSADDPPWVARLEDRLARLEARLAAQGGQGDNGAGIPST